MSLKSKEKNFKTDNAYSFVFTPREKNSLGMQFPKPTSMINTGKEFSEKNWEKNDAFSWKVSLKGLIWGQFLKTVAAGSLFGRNAS